MALRYIECTDITGIPNGAAANSTMLVKLPREGLLEQIDVEFGNTAAGNGNSPLTEAVIKSWTFKAGGGKQREVLSAHLAAINAQNGADYAPFASVTGGANGTGRTVTSMYFREHFRNKARLNSVDTSLFSFPTRWLNDKNAPMLYLPLVDGITPSIRVWAWYNDNDPSDRFGARPLMKWFSDDDNVNTATAQLASIHKGVTKGDRISQINIFNTTDAKTPQSLKMEMTPGNNPIFEDVPIRLLNNRLRNLGMDYAGSNALANNMGLVFDGNDALDDILPSNLNSLKLSVGLSAAAAGSIRTVVQRWGMPEQS
jgi:hypothetical protein